MCAVNTVSSGLTTQGAGVGIVTSLVVTFWIGIGAFYYKPAHRMARRSVMGCLQEYINVTHQDPANVTFPVLLDPDVAKLVEYPLVGALMSQPVPDYLETYLPPNLFRSFSARPV